METTDSALNRVPQDVFGIKMVDAWWLLVDSIFQVLQKWILQYNTEIKAT